MTWPNGAPGRTLLLALALVGALPSSGCGLDGVEAARPGAAQGGHPFECGWQPPVQSALGDGALADDGVLRSAQNEFRLPPLVGEQRVLVKLFPSTASTVLGDAQVVDGVFGEVDAYLRAVSFGRAWLGGDLVHVPPQPGDPPVNADDYLYHLEIHPTESGGSGGGAAYVGWCGYQPCPGPRRIVVDAGNDGGWPPTAAHELGHTFYLSHAEMLYCGIDPIFSPSSGCETRNYMGVFGGPMGFWMGHMNARQAVDLGWLDDGQVTTVGADGVYAIEPMDAASAGPKALRIQRATDKQYGDSELLPDLWVEFRRPAGADAGLPGLGPEGGAVIHLTRWNGGQSPLFLPGMSEGSHLVDPNAAAGDPGRHDRAVLAAGGSFTDPATGTRVTVGSVTPEALTVEVTLGKDSFGAPAVDIVDPAPGFPRPSVGPGAVTITVAASAPTGIARVELRGSSNLLPGQSWPFLLLGSTSSASTDGRYPITFDSARLPRGTAMLWAVAFDRSGAPWGAPGNNASAAGYVTVASDDARPPVVALLEPAPGSMHDNPLRIRATASDDTRIAKVELAIDGSARGAPVAERASGRYDFFLELPPGPHVVRVKATDFGGNVSESAPVPFTATGVQTDSAPPSVTLLGPAPDATVGGTVEVQATAADDVAVAGVRFYLATRGAVVKGPKDLGLVVEPDDGGIYRTTWDTTQVADLDAHLCAVARDAAGRETGWFEESCVPVQVRNLARSDEQIDLSFTVHIVRRKGRVRLIATTSEPGARLSYRLYDAASYQQIRQGTLNLNRRTGQHRAWVAPKLDPGDYIVRIDSDRGGSVVERLTVTVP